MRATAMDRRTQWNFRAIDSHYVFDSSEVRFRHAGPVPHTGRQMYQPNRRGHSRTTLPIELVQVDGVAVLVNHYIDTELRVEDMSYEGLNALGQQIGHVSTGLSEEIITNQMKTKTYLMAASAVNLEEADVCVICQDEYENQDTIGFLPCGHEYHADCLRKWLLVRNVCPLCKSETFILGM
ncbi:hypothetical protein HN51_035686 [Arachis hypogaea]|uniref:RING-type E3 ubiquitin transferase n=2 Tax=Arachis hypogaea TaxID=3818 RepID=A0A445A391_ARAHY|nr:E3 ubiquitin-protein ligase MBR2-like [Arachis ipaensis]XP_025641108.1 probable E3 ubiquitin-protein ligase ZFP1 [Arachis hypogaea]XP_025641109.1 probable E3 ubiquitin-protein ligase ZFP1 [Arachis hypogaea]QHO00851.1 E3 ubiquitin-protein ligase [Arachis hypogaea]QHO00855.1 E3 ubiquitin-protein ligase [Arachis hypogaea]RYR20916.1 hypothetical protein Ahy_B03g066141 [Arachis hypogaea]